MRRCLFLYLIIFLLLFLNSPLLPQNQNLKFEHLSMAEGLPSYTITAICQDSVGYLWFGTMNGLVRYDGYSCKIFDNGAPDVQNIKNKIITCMQADDDGNLWVGTSEHGLFLKDNKNGIIKRLFPSDNDPTSSFLIQSLFIDKSKMVWIIYDNRMLDRFNPVTGELEQFRHVDSDSCSINNNRIGYAHSVYLRWDAICEDHVGRIWFGTMDGGISRYEPESECFKQYKHLPNDSTSLSSNVIRYIHQDSRNIIWICTEGGGLNRYMPESDSFRHYYFDADNINSISSDTCDYIAEDQTGRLWIATKHGYKCPEHVSGKTREPGATLSSFDVVSNNFTSYNHDSLDSSTKLPTYSMPFYSDNGGNMWCSAHKSSAIELFTSDSQESVKIIATPNLPNTFRGYGITSVLSDRSGMLWIGTKFTGINKYNPYIQGFNNIRNIPNDPQSLQNNRLHFLYELPSSPGSVLVGASKTKGIRCLNLSTQKIISKKFAEKSPSINLISNIFAFEEDSSRGLWIAAMDYGVFYLKDGQILDVNDLTQNSNTVGLHRPLCLKLDSCGNLWFGTMGNGLRYVDLNSKQIFSFTHDKFDSTSISNNRILCIYEDQQNDIWIGTENGLNLSRKGHKSFQRYLIGESIQTLLRDRNNLWIGTQHNGLILFDILTKSYIIYDKSRGLANNAIYSIIKDDSDQLWIATEGGLSLFNPKTSQFANFNKENGLPTIKFHRGGIKASDGLIYLGTHEDGIIYFDPKQIKRNTIPPRMVFNEIKVFDKPLRVGSNSPLKQDLSISKEIHLNHWQNEISIETIALHYANPQMNRYQFWLENFDEDWREQGTNRVAHYTNLDPGEYIFHAKGANSDGFWNEEPISLRIVIHPPFWATAWAYAFYVVLLGCIIVAVWRTQLRRIRLHNDLKMREFETEQLKKVDHLKSQFFANISHEFRTPITLIKGPLEKLGEKNQDNDSQKDISIMRRNINRLHRLINQLLDLSALESGKLELNTSTEDVIRLVRYFVQSFESQAKLKEIDLTFNSDRHTLPAVVDKSKMEDIIFNLVSNALKFTNKNGKVEVHVATVHQSTKVNGEWFEIRVSDSGVGIPTDRVPYIFDRFYQVDNSFVREAEGSGIGLSLTKELVELHGGTITVNSSPGAGSVFTVRLPIGDADLDNIHNEALEPMTVAEDEIFEDRDEKKSKGKPLLLIVEDNPDLRSYIRDVMQNGYQFKEAPDGEAGFDLAKKTVPDLIISDVMMPKMDGYQLCEKLKTDQATSHIPVILLTARASKESKLEGLETGADDYLIKPFDSDELNVRVKNLITQRKRLQEQFAKKLSVDPKEIAVTSTDEQFLQRALDVIEKHIADTEFDAEIFAAELSTSRSMLHRKLQGLTGQSTTEFIRSIRLKRAAQLLKDKAGNVTEIAYQVGFNHLSYFAECFKKQFGVNPKEFR